MSAPPPREPREATPRLFREGRTNPLAMHPQAMSVVYEPRDVEEVAQVVDGIATLCIEGPLDHKGGWFFDDYESILVRFRTAIESPDVRAVLLKIDSPGGDASGLNATVDQMRRIKAKTGKPVYAFADESAYSAAYAIACAADEIYLSEAAGVGSIGVISCMIDRTAANAKAGIAVEVITSGPRKADGNPNIPITDDARDHLQRRVDNLAALFFKLVAESRGMSPKAVQQLNADSFYGPGAVEAGLADGVMSLTDLLAALRTSLDKPRKQDMGLLSLTKKLNEAREGLEAAKAEDKAKARARLALAEAALAKKMSEEESEEDESEESEEDESAESDEDDSSDGGDEDDDSESEEDDEDDSDSDSDDDSDDEEEEAKTGLHTKDRLVRMCRKATGKRSIREVMGSLDAMLEAAKRADKLAARVKTLEASSRTARIDQLIAEGKQAKKITPASEAKLRTKAAKHGAEWLASFLEMTKPAVGEELTAAETAVDGSLPSEEQKKIFKSMGMTDEQIASATKILQAKNSKESK